MNSKQLEADRDPGPVADECAAGQERIAAWERFPTLPVLLAMVLPAFVYCPAVGSNETLVRTFLGAGAILLAWAAIVWLRGVGGERVFRIERVAPRRSHYIQGSVQLCIYAYWGAYWPNVAQQAPLIVSQLVFLYVVDGLLSWTRGRRWRLGFGPLPIILSTNIFIWFKPEWYAFQFGLVALAALGKEFVRWERDGRSTHIFNPSAFALCIVSIVLIATNTTHLTWGVEIATTLTRPPHIYLEIFLLGLVVMHFFRTTLMTLSAVAVLVVSDVAWHRATGTYHFIDTNIPIAVFLGLHLLVTDPSTSPRTNGGKVVFGALYGFANFALYYWLEAYNQPEFYDKLLPVPLLNLSVQAFDRWARAGVLGRFDAWQERVLGAQWTNPLNMVAWCGLFAGIYFTGFVAAPHEGANLGFWKQASAEGRLDADRKLFKLANAYAEAGSPEALNALGVIYMQGRIVDQHRAAAGHYFASSCERGDFNGCCNVASQYIHFGEARSQRDMALAFDRLESAMGGRVDGRTCQLLGYAYETGRGRPVDKQRAAYLYDRARKLGDRDAVLGLARLALLGQPADLDLRGVVLDLEARCNAGDPESCLHLGLVLRGGSGGVARDGAKARSVFERACTLGSAQGCDLVTTAASGTLSALPDLTRSAAAPLWRQ